MIVPNGNLLSSELVNWTRSDRLRRIEIDIGVAYGTDPQRVIDLLLEDVRSNSDVLADPGPSVLFLGFGDSSLDFSVRAWTLDFDNHLRVKSELMVSINQVLAGAEIVIPFPQRDLHLRSVDESVGGGATLPGGSPTPSPEVSP